VLRDLERFEGLINWRLGCLPKVKDCSEERSKQFMYTIRECVACVVLVFTLSTMLFGLGVVLLTIEWKFESLVRTSGDIQPDGSRFFSRSAVREARQAVVGQWNALYARCLKWGASMAYRSPILVASSDAMIQDSQVQSRRPSLR
jgi:hypothetical protein